MTQAPVILVIRLGAMGDLVHAMPAVAAIKRRYPQARIHWVTSPMYVQLLTMTLDVDYVWTYDKRSGLKGLVTLSQTLRQAGISHIVNLHPSLKTWLLTKLVGARHCAVYRKQKLNVFGQAQRAMTRRHAIDDFFEPFRLLFTNLPLLEPGERVAHITLPILHQAEAQTSLVVGLIPGVGAKRANRAWPIEQYQALIAQLLYHLPSATIRLFGGPDEAEWAQTLVVDERVENTCGQTDIPKTAQALAACQVVVGGDTGPTHLASAVGVPVIGLFGPTSVNRTGPVDSGHTPALVPAASLTCWPCEQPVCPLQSEEHLACMRSISIEAVVQAVLQIIHKTKSANN